MRARRAGDKEFNTTKRVRLAAILVPVGLVACLLWYFAADHVAFSLLPIRTYAGFGQITAQCAAAYGHANVIFPKEMRMSVSPQTRGYVKAGFSILIGFDEQGRAEQFVVSKAKPSSARDLSEPEQQLWLGQLAEGSTWTLQVKNNGDGPIWLRADGNGCAAYIMGNHYLVVLNRHGMDRQIRGLQQK